MRLFDLRGSDAFVAVTAFACFFCALFFTSVAFAQYEQLPQAGITPYTPYQHSDIDIVNLHTGNVNVHIPLVSFPQLGSQLKLDFVIRYNEPQWSVDGIYFSAGISVSNPGTYKGQWLLTNTSVAPRLLV